VGGRTEARIQLTPIEQRWNERRKFVAATSRSGPSLKFRLPKGNVGDIFSNLLCSLNHHLAALSSDFLGSGPAIGSFSWLCNSTTSRSGKRMRAPAACSSQPSSNRHFTMNKARGIGDGVS
jgi:hypothetical protein